MRTLAILLLALLLVHLTAAKCNSKIVKKIQALNLNNENVLSTLVGNYRFVFLSFGRINAKTSGICAKLRVYKEENVYKIDYVNVVNGTHKIYTAELVNGAIQQTGEDGNVDMVAHIVVNGPDVIAFYTCYDAALPTMPFIAVSVNAENVEEKYETAKKDLVKVGVKNGVEMPACMHGDGEPVSEGDQKGNATDGEHMANTDDVAYDDDDDDEEEYPDAHDEHGGEHEHKHQLEEE